MTDNTQPEALDLADWLEAVGDGLSTKRCAALLRSQHARIAELEQEVAHTDSLLGKANALARVRAHHIAELEAQLEAIGAGGVSGPLLGHPQAMPDLSQLTERGAKAWAGVDAQRLRDGGASPSANAGEPSGHIKEPYTLAEIKAKIASNDYSAEMLLQHAMLLLDSASLSASAGSEPVAWRYVDARGHFRYVGYKPSRDMAAEYPLLKPIRLYLHPSSPEGMVGGWTKPHRTITYTCPVCVASLERQK